MEWRSRAAVFLPAYLSAVPPFSFLLLPIRRRSLSLGGFAPRSGRRRSSFFLLGLRNDPDVRLRGFPAGGIRFLRFLVRDRSGDGAAPAGLPVGGRRNLVLGSQLQRVDHAQHLVEVPSGRHRVGKTELHLLIRSDDEYRGHGLIVGRRAALRSAPT